MYTQGMAGKAAQVAQFGTGRHRAIIEKGETRVCALAGCGRTFKPIQATQKYCCESHQRTSGWVRMACRQFSHEMQRFLEASVTKK